MSIVTTTDTIKLQLQDLVVGHYYRVVLKLHKPSSLMANLDREEVLFTAGSNKQNIFVLLTKDASLPVVSVEIIVTDLTDTAYGSSSMVVTCPDYTSCGDEGDFLPITP